MKSFYFISLSIIITFISCKSFTNRNDDYLPAETSMWAYLGRSTFRLMMLENTVIENSQVLLKFDETNQHLILETPEGLLKAKYAKTKSILKLEIVQNTITQPKDAITKKLVQYFSKKLWHYDVADQVINFYDENNLVMMFGITKV